MSTVYDFVEAVHAWFSEIDNSLEILSKGTEHRTVNLLKWTLTPRRINIFRVRDRHFNVVTALPDSSLHSDVLQEINIDTDAELVEAYKPLKSNRTIPSCPIAKHCIYISDLKLIQADAPFALPVFEYPGLIIEITDDLVPVEFTFEKAKLQAIDIWNNVALGIKAAKSFPENVKDILVRLGFLVKRKAFLERRIHRFVNEFKSIILA